MTETKAKTTAKNDTFFKAFIKSQTEFPTVPKDATATMKGISKAGKPYEYDYDYASLPTVMGAVLPVLNSNKIALFQVFQDGKLVTKLIHESGDGIESEMPCSDTGLTAQDFGKKTSYYRRYALIAILGLAPDDDDDGATVGAADNTPPSPASDTPANIHDTAARRLIADDRDLIKAWSIAPLATEGEALIAVGDFLGTLDVDPGDDLYTVARAALNCVVDERNANA